MSKPKAPAPKASIGWGVYDQDGNMIAAANNRGTAREMRAHGERVAKVKVVPVK